MKNEKIKDTSLFKVSIFSKNFLLVTKFAGHVSCYFAGGLLVETTRNERKFDFQGDRLQTT